MPISSACRWPARNVDMVWSNLTLQWLDPPDQAFGELLRILRPQGLLMFSTLGPDTLKSCASLADLMASIMSTASSTCMTSVMHCGCGPVFEPVMDMEYITLTYESVKAVLLDLKAIGAQQLQEGRNPGLMGRQRWQKVLAGYERLRRGGLLRDV